jgi:hypothetical protein
LRRRSQGIRSIKPLQAAALDRKAEIHAIGDMAKFVVMGADVPKKQVEMLQYFAGTSLSLIVQRVSHAPPSTVIMSNV